MNKQELADLLNGRQYGNEITDTEARLAKESGLVVVYGYSDDGIEFRGAIDEELGAFNGTTVCLTSNGHVIDSEQYRKDVEVIGKYGCLVHITEIKALWCKNDYTWSYATAIPHCKFTILEGDTLFCEGIVFLLTDLNKGADLIAIERADQIKKHGFDVTDRDYKDGELVEAALFSLDPKFEFDNRWPNGWHDYYKQKIKAKTRIGQLTVAGAFLAAEIDRLQSV